MKIIFILWYWGVFQAAVSPPHWVRCRHCAGSHRVGSGAALVVFAHDTED